MTCESCKGTRRITLAYSVVECLDCAKPASLPAAPMAKCGAGPMYKFKVGDKFRHQYAPGMIGTIVGYDDGPCDYMVTFNGNIPHYDMGVPLPVCQEYMTKLEEDTI
jgi:hypothetical protein